jgi:hypothetical protein
MVEREVLDSRVSAIMDSGMHGKVQSVHQGDTARLIVGSALRLGAERLQFDFSNPDYVTFKLDRSIELTTKPV